nr:MAG TPA: hypothetical protein [Caudoviricetes sp.]
MAINHVLLAPPKHNPSKSRGLNSKSAALRLLFLCPKRAYGVKLRTEKTSRQAINGGNHNGRNKHNRNRNQQG